MLIMNTSSISFVSDSNKIVHLKDVFQNQYEIVLVLEYAPGGCFLRVLSRVGHAESASRTYVGYSTIYAAHISDRHGIRICMAIPSVERNFGKTARIKQ